MIRVVIVDDEAPARELLREYLAADDDCEIAAECTNGFEAVKAVAQHDPDLLLLDIQMPKLDGFEVLELLDRSPIVVFVTAHDEHALRAFEVHALDYLLKPFSQERFRQVMERVKRSAGHHDRSSVAGMAASLRARPLQRVVVRGDDGAIQVVPVARLDYAEAADDAILIATGAAKLRKQQPIGELAEQLDPARFVRIHRAYLVNIERIEKIELYAKDSRVAILRDGTRLPVSRSGYQRLRELL
ncbi:MAG: two-component system, LytTR family, response regulator [Thermoanaerobaculia bacterium]|jgi:two-component system LytT family response regulator|nr:two-component system, LytTR family, response regulator [Thermoanaerobaculia bacterium]